jgi:hypothetical protein
LLSTSVRPDQRAVGELDLYDLPVLLHDDVHVGIELGALDGNLEPVGGDATRQLSAPVTAQLFPAAAELPRCVRDSALHLDGAALGGAANGLPDLTRFIRKDVGDAAL